MTAREEAREAAKFWEDPPDVEQAADAVSDVWEPIVRNLLLDIRFCGQRPGLSALVHQEGFKQALKALGVEDLSRIN